jgi:hypothetical protein
MSIWRARKELTVASSICVRRFCISFPGSFDLAGRADAFEGRVVGMGERYAEGPFGASREEKGKVFLK